MTRQHFQAIADAFKTERPGENWDGNKKTQWNLDVKAIAKVCSQFNGGFKKDRFFAACGGLFEGF